MILKLTPILFFFIVVSPLSYSQSFGFGCLGLVGGFGGYSFQRYQPTGLNDYISSFNEVREDSLTTRMGNFGTLKGIRVGINFFRADFQGFILTTKGFYQSLLEKHEAAVISTPGETRYKYEVELKNWGVGVDLGTSITRSFSWKVIDAALLFNTVTFTDSRNYPGGFTQVEEYQSESALGYSIGTGFIYSLIEGYISIEGLAGYTQMTIGSMKNEDVELTINETSTQPMTNFIDNGGFIAVIQLNIGFPL